MGVLPTEIDTEAAESYSKILGNATKPNKQVTSDLVLVEKAGYNETTNDT